MSNLVKMITVGLVVMINGPKIVSGGTLKTMNTPRTSQFEMNNQLRVLLVSDPTRFDAAAAVAVRAGAWDDPDDAPGMAHFLEHMLFLGSEEFHEAGDFISYLSKYAGTTNAFTGFDRTVFSFSCQVEGLQGAMQRFGEFFTHPLLTQKSVESERLSVDQEFRMDMNHDGWRQQMVEAHLSNSRHPHSRYAIGTTRSLAHVDSARLRSWFEEHYSSNLMTLMVVAPLGLDELRALVELTFQEVPNRSLRPPTITQSLLLPESAGKIVHIEPVRAEARHLTLRWEVPADPSSERQFATLLSIAYTLSAPTDGSLIASLRRDGLVMSGVARRVHQLTGTAQFTIDFELTDEGVRQRDRVLHTCFASLAKMRRHGVESEVFEEMMRLRAIGRVSSMKGDSATVAASFASGLLGLGAEDDPDPLAPPAGQNAEHTSFMLSYLRAAYCHISLVARPALSGVSGQFIEPQMQVRYTEIPYKSQTLREWDADVGANSSVVTTVNPYIAKSVDIVPVDHLSPSVNNPLLIVDSEQARIFYAQDVAAPTHEISWIVDLLLPAYHPRASFNSVIAQLHGQQILRSAVEIAALGARAGFKVRLEIPTGHLRMMITGPAAMADKILADLLAEIQKSTLPLDSFETARKTLRRQLLDKGAAPPAQVALESLANLLAGGASTVEQIEALDSVTYEEFRTSPAVIGGAMYVEATLAGNMDEVTARRTGELLLAEVVWSGERGSSGKNVRPLPLSGLPQRHTVRLTTGAHGGAAVVMFDEGSDTPENRAVGAILDLILKPKFYDALRTRDQAGYLVQTLSQSGGGRIVRFFIVEPHHSSNEQVLGAIEAFLDEQRTGFAFHKQNCGIFSGTGPSESDFLLHKAAILRGLAEPLDGAERIARRLHGLAFSFGKQFDMTGSYVKALQELSYNAFLGRAEAIFANSQRVVVLVNGR
jgi:insulysin